LIVYSIFILDDDMYSGGEEGARKGPSLMPGGLKKLN